MPELRKRLLAGETLVGTMITFTEHPDLAKVLASAGLDFMMLDCEHGYIAYEKASAIISAAHGAGLSVLMRVPGPGREAILRFSDMGADGLMLPNCDSADLARQLVLHAKYAPLGHRGISMFRGHSEYRPIEDKAAYMRGANEHTLLIAQIESPEGVADIDAITALEGIDAALIGPNDLSASLGIPDRTDAPLFVDSVQKVIDACRRNGKAAAIHCGSPAALRPWMQRGMRLVMCSSESQVLYQGYHALVQELKK